LEGWALERRDESASGWLWANRELLAWKMQVDSLSLCLLCSPPEQSPQKSGGSALARSRRTLSPRLLTPDRHRLPWVLTPTQRSRNHIHSDLDPTPALVQCSSLANLPSPPCSIASTNSRDRLVLVRCLGRNGFKDISHTSLAPQQPATRRPPPRNTHFSPHRLLRSSTARLFPTQTPSLILRNVSPQLQQVGQLAGARARSQQSYGLG
jgi:hypothetical protein